jgi:hypothetical protein
MLNYRLVYRMEDREIMDEQAPERRLKGDHQRKAPEDWVDCHRKSKSDDSFDVVFVTL